ncbi:type II secretion system protein [Cerasicoccus frondis]|uniref:type II secretion system protein n=1 Tax=Cerasicoccus frondis TaxID=490090 RepID=UPI002852B5FE|nr:type II secretion system protein [Cerasicoccus frondis]
MQAHYRGGFTLIELLTAIAIVGILGSILFSSIGNVKQQANRSAATSQMRSIGSAVLMYTQQNNNILPGPLRPYQQTAYNPDPDGQDQLATLLASYLDVNEGVGLTLVPAFLTPGCEEVMSHMESTHIIAFMLNMQMGLKTGAPFKPWGSSEKGPRGAQPKSFSVLTNEWGFVQADAQLPFVKADIANRMPAEPLYGDNRLAWFFDGSVQSVPLDYFNDHTPGQGGGGGGQGQGGGSGQGGGQGGGGGKPGGGKPGGGKPGGGGGKPPPR